MNNRKWVCDRKERLYQKPTSPNPPPSASPSSHFLRASSPASLMLKDDGSDLDRLDGRDLILSMEFAGVLDPDSGGVSLGEDAGEGPSGVPNG